MNGAEIISQLRADGWVMSADWASACYLRVLVCGRPISGFVWENPRAAGDLWVHDGRELFRRYGDRPLVDLQAAEQVFWTLGIGVVGRNHVPPPELFVDGKIVLGLQVSAHACGLSGAMARLEVGVRAVVELLEPPHLTHWRCGDRTGCWLPLDRDRAVVDDADLANVVTCKRCLQRIALERRVSGWYWRRDLRRAFP